MSVGIVIAIVIGVAIFVGLIVLGIFLRSGKFKGQNGEKQVSSILEQYIKKL